MPERRSLEGQPALKAAPVAPPASRMLEDIREKPKANWTIENIVKACNQLGMSCAPPSHGSHFKISSPKLSGILIIPAKRPIKILYIKHFLAIADAHIKSADREKTNV